MKKKELSYGFLLLVNMPRSLLLYLISVDLLHKFIKRAVSDQCSTYLQKVIEKRAIERFIFVNAFSWNKTPEGYDFWYRRYLEYCNINNL